MKVKEFVCLLVLATFIAKALPAYAGPEASVTGNAVIQQNNVSIPSNVDGLFIVKDARGNVIKPYKLNKSQIVVLPDSKEITWTFIGSNVDARYKNGKSSLKISWGIDGNLTPFWDKKSPARLKIDEADFLSKGGSDYFMAQAEWTGSHSSAPWMAIGPIPFGGRGKDGHFWGGMEIQIWHKACDVSSMSSTDIARWIEVQSGLANNTLSYNSLPDSAIKEDRDYQSEKVTGETVVKTNGANRPKPEDFGLCFQPFPTRDGDQICITTTAKVDYLLQREWTQNGSAKLKADQLCAEAGRPVRITFHPGMVLRIIDPTTRQVLVSFDDKGQVIN